jgi:hypothetical protein
LILASILQCSRFVVPLSMHSSVQHNAHSRKSVAICIDLRRTLLPIFGAYAAPLLPAKLPLPSCGLKPVALPPESHVD